MSLRDESEIISVMLENDTMKKMIQDRDLMNKKSL